MRNEIGNTIAKKELFENVFSPQEQQYMRQLYDDLNLVAGKQKGAINNSSTGAWTADLITGLGKVFNNPLINGNRKLTLTFQTQTYAPGNWHGFHFSPFYNMTFGLLGNVNDKVFDDRLYSKFSIGMLINNDYLVFNSFQISFSYYPSIPYEGTNIFKSNSFKNDDLALPDFQIGQPVIVPFK
jgi:hypothetical protein